MSIANKVSVCGYTWLKLLLLVVVAGVSTGCATTGQESSTEQQARKNLPPVDPLAKQAFDAALKAMADGDDAKAERILLKMTQDFPALSGPQANLGIIYYRAKKMDKAEAAFTRAVDINPSNAASLDYLGVIQREKGKFKEAEAFYQRAIKADPAYAAAHRNYGILLELYMGKLKDALAQYKKYQELSGGKDKLVAKWVVDLERRSGKKNEGKK